MVLKNFLLVIVAVWCTAKVVHGEDTHDVFVPSSSPVQSVDRHALSSAVLEDSRVVEVALPASYRETGDSHRYPVIIVLDGELLFPMVSGIVHQMAANSQMPESIVVGLMNKAGTRRDITPTPLRRDGTPLWFGGKQDRYLAFLVDELIPFLEGHYRAAAFRTLVGLSPTGQFALHAAWKQPGALDAVIAINTADFRAAGYGEQSAFDKIVHLAEQEPDTLPFLYVSMPQEGVSRNPHIGEAYAGLTRRLERLGIAANKVRTDAIDKSGYAATLPALLAGLDLVFPASDWDVPYRTFLKEETGGTVAAAKAYFDGLTRRYGFQALPKGDRFYNRNRLSYLGHYLLNEGRTEDALDVFRYWRSQYPGSANACDSMAAALEAAGQKEAAHEMRQKAIELARQNGDFRLDIFEANMTSAGQN